MGDDSPDGEDEAEEEETFTLTLEDVTLDGFIALVGAVGTMQFEAFAASARGRAKQSGELLHQLLMENQDLAREALLRSEDAEYIHVAQMPEDVLEELEIEIVDGHVRDANATQVEVE